MSKSTFNTRLASVAKSYRNASKVLLGLAVEAVIHAKENDHNPILMQKVLDVMEGRDINDMALIFTNLAPVTIVEGTIKPIKSKKDRVYNETGISSAGDYKSFRTFADTFRGAKEKEKKPFDAEKYAAQVLKKIEDEMTPEQFAQVLSKVASAAKSKTVVDH